jgi:hypothetical protein
VRVRGEATESRRAGYPRPPTEPSGGGGGASTLVILLGCRVHPIMVGALVWLNHRTTDDNEPQG